MKQATILVFILFALTRCSDNPTIGKGTVDITDNLKQDSSSIQLENPIAGKYILLDRSNSKTKVEFKKDYTLTGFYSFKSYSIMTEIEIDGKLSRFNELCFTVSKYSNICFVYKINGDTINLYKSIEDDTEDLQPSQIEFRFVRQ